MALTQSMIDLLNADAQQKLASQSPPPVESSGGFDWGRLGSQLGNLPSNTGSAVFEMLKPAIDVAYPELQQTELKVPQVFDIPEAQTTSDQWTDMLAGNLAPQLASAMIPYVGLTKLANANKFGTLLMNPAIREATAQGVSGALVSTEYGPQAMATAGFFGAAAGATEGLTRSKRVVPALIVAGTEYGVLRKQGLSHEDALTQAMITAGTSMLPGQASRAGQAIKQSDTLDLEVLGLPSTERLALPPPPNAVIEMMPAGRDVIEMPDMQRPQLTLPLSREGWTPEGSLAIEPGLTSRIDLPAPEGGLIPLPSNVTRRDTPEGAVQKFYTTPEGSLIPDNALVDIGPRSIPRPLVAPDGSLIPVNSTPEGSLIKESIPRAVDEGFNEQAVQYGLNAKTNTDIENILAGFRKSKDKIAALQKKGADTTQEEAQKRFFKTAFETVNSQNLFNFSEPIRQRIVKSGILSSEQAPATNVLKEVKDEIPAAGIVKQAPAPLGKKKQAKPEVERLPAEIVNEADAEKLVTAFSDKLRRMRELDAIGEQRGMNRVESNEYTTVVKDLSNIKSTFESSTGVGNRGDILSDDYIDPTFHFSKLPKTLQEKAYETGLAPKLSPAQRLARLKQLNESGSVQSELLQGIAGAGLGGLIGGATDNGDPASIALGVMAGGIGSATARRLITEAAQNTPRNSMPPAKGTDVLKREVKNVGEKVRLLSSSPETLARQDTFGLGGITSKIVRGIEKGATFNMPDIIKNIKVRASGPVGGVVEKFRDKLNDAAKNYSDVALTDSFKSKYSDYIEGRVQNTVLYNMMSMPTPRAMTSKAYDAAGKPSNLDTTWVTYDKNGDKVIWHIASRDKDQLAKQVEVDFIKSLTPEERPLQEFAIQSRKALDELVQMNAAGMPADLAKELLDSKYQYVTRTYKIFTEKNFNPLQKDIDDRIAELMQGRSMDQLPAIRSEVLSEIQKMRDLAKQRRKSGAGSKDDIDVSTLIERKQLTPAQRKMMGENRAIDMVTESIARLAPSATASIAIKAFSQARLPNGLKAAYSRKELNDAVSLETANLSKATVMGNAKDAEIAQLKLDELASYIQYKDSSPVGVLNDKHVSRFVYDSIEDLTQSWGPFNNQWGKGLSQLNRYAKVSATSLSAVTTVRNFLSIPQFLLVGKVSFPDMANTFKALRAKDSDIRKLLVDNGIRDVTYSSQELRQGAAQALTGKINQGIGSKAQRAMSKMIDFYGIPDNFQRSATFMAAMRRESRKAGIDFDPMKGPIGSPQKVQAVLDASLNFTRERTFDYKNIAPVVKFAREVPGVNLFISYSWEMARIATNLARDAKNGDVHAMTSLGVLVGAPFAAKAYFEGQLSDEDRADWENIEKQSMAYDKHRIRFPTGRNADGTFTYRDIHPLVAMGDYLSMASAITKGDWKGLLEVNPVLGLQNNPALNTVSELITGRNIRTGREWKSGKEFVLSTIEKFVPPETPLVGREYNRVMPPSMGIVPMARGGIPSPVTGKRETIETYLNRLFTGTNVGTIDPKIIESYTAKNAKRLIQEERNYYNKLVKNGGLSESRLKFELEKTSKAIEALVADTKYKLGTD